MNRRELKGVLEKADVKPEAYDLESAGKEEAYTLRQDGNLWHAFYSERGHRNDERTFTSEGEACEYFAQLVLSDPSARTNYKLRR